jgi:SulP family sulfate permease
VQTYALYGSLFFGAATKLEPLLAHGSPDDPARAVVLDMHKVISVDNTGLDILEALHRTLARNGKTLILSDANPQPRGLFERSGFADRLGRENLTPDLELALARAHSAVAARELAAV